MFFYAIILRSMRHLVRYYDNPYKTRMKSPSKPLIHTKTCQYLYIFSIFALFLVYGKEYRIDSYLY